jgi:hypothetical protein
MKFFVRASSIQKAHEMGKLYFPVGSYSTRKPLPFENPGLDKILNAG